MNWNEGSRIGMKKSVEHKISYICTDIMVYVQFPQDARSKYNYRTQASQWIDSPHSQVFKWKAMIFRSQKKSFWQQNRVVGLCTWRWKNETKIWCQLDLKKSNLRWGIALLWFKLAKFMFFFMQLPKYVIQFWKCRQ